MKTKPLNDYDKKSILGEELLEEIFDQEDEIYKARLLLACQERAATLGVKGRFDELVKAYKKVSREMQKKKSVAIQTLENWTNFEGPYDNMRCKYWIAGEDGIYSMDSSKAEQLACYHPILPIERLKNLETGEEQVRLAFKRGGRWEEKTVPKTLITSANKIVALSTWGIAVTSENARLLVKYLADVENANGDSIQVQYSSSKLGWIKHDFLPYDTEIVFDGDSRFKQVFESIQEYGSRNKWFDYITKLRKTGRMEIKFMLAASFSSILLKLLGALPYIVDLWGETEGGKTVSLMLACSVWADPDENRYIGDFKTTDVALEARADLLNHLPMILDDTSKVSSKIRDNFEGIVYDLCSGKGKSRSNKELGMNRENHWKNVVLTNGERPLSAYVQQGGAINRILEIECREKVYQDPQETAELLKRNYGFAGKEFVQAIKEMGIDKIREIQQEIQAELADDEKMQKQSISLSIVLTADRIATDYLFKDGEYINLQDAKAVLTDKNEISDNERCYNYLIDKIAMNPSRFDDETKIEKWGLIEKGYAILYNPAFDELCSSGGFSRKSFLSWAARKKLIQTQGGNPTKVKKIEGKPIRSVFLKLDGLDGCEETPIESGFVTAGIQETLMFQ